MIKKPELIRDKNIVLHGGTYDERQKNVASIKNAFLSKWHTGTIFTLSEQPRNYERFLKSVRMKLPVKSQKVIKFTES